MAGRHNITVPLLVFDDAARLVRDKNFSRAREVLESADSAAAHSTNPNSWITSANLGLIAESEHSPKNALQYFQTALERFPATGSRTKAARLQLKIAQCWTQLGNKSEARNALVRAAELDPDNINVHIALRRLSGTR